MRSAMLTLGVAALVAVAMIVYADEKPAPTTKPASVTIKGEVVDLNCFLDHGARGEKHKECAVMCAKAGNPIGLVDDKGETYLLMGANHKSYTDDLIKNMAGTVNVTGKLVKSGGLQAIYVESLEAAK